MENNSMNGLLLTLLIIAAIIVVVMFALLVAAEWKIFQKAGEKGWKAFIPFYGVYLSHEIVGMHHVWFIIELIIWIAEVLFELIPVIPQPVAIVFGIVAGIFTIISELIHIIKMCDCFGKGTGFKIGMCLLPGLFFMILAYGKAEYHKPEH